MATSTPYGQDMPPPVPRTPNKSRHKICMKCNVPIIPAATGFACGLCTRHIHVSCAGGTYQPEEVTKLRRSTVPFIFVCNICKPKLRTGEITRTYDEEINIIQEKYKKEASELTSYYTAQFAKLTDEITTRDALLVETKRELELAAIELNKSKGTTVPNTNKRTRTDDADDHLREHISERQSIIDLMKLLIEKQADPKSMSFTLILVKHLIR